MPLHTESPSNQIPEIGTTISCLSPSELAIARVGFHHVAMPIERVDPIATAMRIRLAFINRDCHSHFGCLPEIPQTRAASWDTSPESGPPKSPTRTRRRQFSGRLQRFAGDSWQSRAHGSQSRPLRTPQAAWRSQRPIERRHFPFAPCPARYSRRISSTLSNVSAGTMRPRIFGYVVSANCLHAFSASGSSVCTCRPRFFMASRAS